MECGCAVQGYRDPRCKERGMCGLTVQDQLRNLADAMVDDIMAMSDEEILAETTPEELADAIRIRDKVIQEHGLKEAT